MSAVSEMPVQLIPLDPFGKILNTNTCCKLALFGFCVEHCSTSLTEKQATPQRLGPQILLFTLRAMHFIQPFSQLFRFLNRLSSYHISIHPSLHKNKISTLLKLLDGPV